MKEPDIVTRCRWSGNSSLGRCETCIEAADEIRRLRRQLRQLRSDVLSVMPENWREDQDWVALVEAQKLTPNAPSSADAKRSAGMKG